MRRKSGMRRGARQKDHLFEKFQNPIIPLSGSSIEFKFRFFQLWVLAEFFFCKREQFIRNNFAKAFQDIAHTIFYFIPDFISPSGS